MRSLILSSSLPSTNNQSQSLLVLFSQILMPFSSDTLMKNDTGEDGLGKLLDLATRRPLMTCKGPVSAAIL